MLKTVEMYYVECDNCKKSFFENEEYSAYADESLALENAMEQDGSVEFEEKHYCVNCAHFDDDDNLIIKKFNQ